MNANGLGFQTQSARRPPDLRRCSHGLNLGDVCAACNAEGLEAVKRQYAAAKRCKVCNRLVRHWVDYCGECTQEDEPDCW
jgi:hypothetical protein